MYPAARIVSFLLSLIAYFLFLCAVLVWVVVTDNRPMFLAVRDGAGPATADQVEARKAEKAKQDQAQFEANVVKAGASAGFVLVGLVILAFCDLVRAVVNTATDTKKLLDATLAANAKRVDTR